MRNSHHGRRHYHCHRDRQQPRQDKLIPELAGAIFMCNNDTRKECFSRRIFGLPACRERFVRRVTDGMFLFLFDTDDRKMYGVFKATSNGAMNIVPEAYSSSGSTYPAQVPFEIIRKCKPLTEPEFKPAILEKYFTDVKFNFDLNFDQVQRLLVLFEEKEVRGVPQSVTDRWDPSSSTDSPLKRCYVHQQRGDMSNTDTLSQTILRHVRNPNPSAEVAMLFMNSDMNLATPRNINPHHRIDADVVKTQTQICHTGDANLCQCTYEPAQQGVLNSSSLRLAQQQGRFGYCTGMGNCEVCTQKMVPDMAYNSSLLQRAPCGLHVNPDNQQVTLSAYNHLNLSSPQAVQLYAPDPPCPENIKMTVGACSNFYGGSLLSDQVYNSGSQLEDVKRRKSVFLRLARNPQRTAQETYPCQIGVYPTRNQPDHHTQQLSHPTDNRAARQPRPVYNKQVVQDQEPVHIHGLASADADAVPDTAPVSTVNPGETPICIVNFKRRNGGSKLIIEVEGDEKKRRLVRSQRMNMDTEAGPDPDPDVVDKMEVIPTAPVSNSTVGPDETQIPFVNFNRRNGGSKVSIEPKEDKKNRRLIRPSLALELENKNSHLQVFEGPMQAAMYFNEPLRKPSLVSTESSLDGESSMIITDTMDVDARVDSKNSELLQGSICKSRETQTEVELVDTPLEVFEGNNKGKKAESLIPTFGQCRGESNEILVSMEIESKKRKQDFLGSKEPLFTSDICLDKLPEKSKVETKSDGPQMVLVSGFEKPDTSISNETITNLSEGQPELLVLGKKTDEKKSVYNPEPIDTEPIIEIKDNSVLEREPDNSKISLGLHEKSNLVKEWITLEPKANKLKTILVLRKAYSNPIEEHIALEPEADKLKMDLFSFCQNSKPAEDYIALESHDENSKEMVEYLEIADQDYITLD